MQPNRFSNRHSRGAALSAILAVGAFATSVSPVIAQVPVQTSTATDKPASPINPKFVSLGTAIDGANASEMTAVLSTPDAAGALIARDSYHVIATALGEAHVDRTALETLDAATLKKKMPILQNPTLGVTDGKSTFEYDPAAHLYMKFAVPPADIAVSRTVPIRPLWFAARGLSQSNFVADADEMLDGRKMLVRNADLTRKGDDHPLLRNRYLIDAETHLLRRAELVLWHNDKEMLAQRFDFSDWKINPVIPAGLFAWQPPVDAKETVIPKAAPRAAAPALLAAGTMAPDFTCVGADGKDVKLSDMRGKIVILDFWATWCGPCQRSMPHLEHVYSQVRDKNVTVLALCVSDLRPAYDKWMVEHKTTYSFPLAFDPAERSANGVSGSKYRVSGIPTQYVIDKDGKVVTSLVGFEGNGDHRLEAALAGLGVAIPVPTETATVTPASTK